MTSTFSTNWRPTADLVGAQEGADPDVLRVRGSGQGGEGKQGERAQNTVDGDAGTPRRRVGTGVPNQGAQPQTAQHPYRSSPPAGTTVIVKGWPRAVPYDSVPASKNDISTAGIR